MRCSNERRDGKRHSRQGNYIFNNKKLSLLSQLFKIVVSFLKCFRRRGCLIRDKKNLFYPEAIFGVFFHNLRSKNPKLACAVTLPWINLSFVKRVVISGRNTWPWRFMLCSRWLFKWAVMWIDQRTKSMAMQFGFESLTSLFLVFC